MNWATYIPTITAEQLTARGWYSPYKEGFNNDALFRSVTFEEFCPEQRTIESSDYVYTLEDLKGLWLGFRIAKLKIRAHELVIEGKFTGINPAMKFLGEEELYNEPLTWGTK